MQQLFLGKLHLLMNTSITSLQVTRSDLCLFVNVSRRTSLEDIEDEDEIEEYESEDNADSERKVKRLLGALKAISAQALFTTPLHLSSLWIWPPVNAHLMVCSRLVLTLSGSSNSSETREKRASWSILCRLARREGHGKYWSLYKWIYQCLVAWLLSHASDRRWRIERNVTSFAQHTKIVILTPRYSNPRSCKNRTCKNLHFLDLWHNRFFYFERVIGNVG